MDTLAQERNMIDAQLESELAALESEMPHLQARSPNVFALANAWAERHDAIMAATPSTSRDYVESRLRRIGIRWGLTQGVRVTAQLPALPPENAI